MSHEANPNGGHILIVNTSFEDGFADGKGSGLYMCLYTGEAGGGTHSDIAYLNGSRFCGNVVNSTSEPWGAAIQYDCAGAAYLTAGLFGGNTVLGTEGGSLETVFDSTGNLVVTDGTPIPGRNGVPTPGPVKTSALGAVLIVLNRNFHDRGQLLL